MVKYKRPVQLDPLAVGKCHMNINLEHNWLTPQSKLTVTAICDTVYAFPYHLFSLFLCDISPFRPSTTEAIGKEQAVERGESSKSFAQDLPHMRQLYQTSSLYSQSTVVNLGSSMDELSKPKQLITGMLIP